MMTKKKILIVEDDKETREELQRMLEECGFEVYSASNADEAYQEGERHWEELDVVMLDMLLSSDPKKQRPTGAEIAIRLRQEKDSFPPESLIYSTKSEIDFYRLALKLSAAAYLLKEEDSYRVVVQHARVLALRRALNGDNPNIIPEVARIAVHSRSKSEAIQLFCRRVLKPEFEACLGTSFIILFTDEEKNITQNCADNAKLPAGSSPFYHTLQALAHGKGNLTEPFVLETNKLEPPLEKEIDLYQKLNRAAFLPLSLSNNLRLSIGILEQQQTDEATSAQALCTVLAQYLRPTVLENIMSIWSQWTELRATRNSTAKLCLSVGQEINDGLDTADLEQLEDLADDLKDTGQILIELDNRKWQDESEAISVRKVLAETWESVAPAEDTAAIKLDLQGDCSAQVQKKDLEIIVWRLLQWYVYRGKAMPLDVEPVIKVNCASTEGEATITFEDNSNRLPKKLREDMFAPFTQAISTPFANVESSKMTVDEGEGEPPGKKHLNTGRYLPLYLAKMLVEGRYHGFLEDHSDEIEEHIYGHRIVMQIPVANKMN